MSIDERLSWSREEWHEKCHHPYGVKAKHYLTLPFRGLDIRMTEWWIYSTEERELYNRIVHAGIDFALPYGTPIVAPCDGWLITSYHLTMVRDSNKSVKFKEGKPVGYGLGYFGQFHPKDQNRILQLGHLSDIHPDIPFSMPVRVNENEWNPTNHQLLRHQLNKNRFVIKMKTGDPIGWSGHSGQTWGYEEYREGETRPIRIDPVSCPSHDDDHVHMEDARRDEEGNKAWQRDILDKYGMIESQSILLRREDVGPETLFIVDPQTGLPVFPK